MKKTLRDIPKAAPFPHGAPRPLYQRVKDHIFEQLAAGMLHAGDRVPSEHELVRSLGVSRMTANRALKELTAEGVVTRVPGVGTFIAERHLRVGFMEIRDIAEEIKAAGHRHHCVIHALERIKATAAIAEALERQLESPVFHSLIVHYQDDLAVQVEDRYVNPDVVPGYLDVDFTQRTAHRYLSDAAPISEFEHIVEAVLPDPATQKLLGIRSSEPCLRLFRRTWSAGKAISCAWLTHPGRLYRMSARSTFNAGAGI